MIFRKNIYMCEKYIYIFKKGCCLLEIFRSKKGLTPSIIGKRIFEFLYSDLLISK